MNSTLRIITDPKEVLYFVTVYDFPHSTVRHQVPDGHTMIEKVTTFAEWIELEAARGAKKTGMSFGKVENKQGQVALAALRINPIR